MLAWIPARVAALKMMTEWEIYMTRLDKVIKAFNDYDNLVKQLIEWLDEVDGTVAEYRVNKLRNEVSPLIGELKRYGCRRRGGVIDIK